MAHNYFALDSAGAGGDVSYGSSGNVSDATSAGACIDRCDLLGTSAIESSSQGGVNSGVQGQGLNILTNSDGQRQIINFGQSVGTVHNGTRDGNRVQNTGRGTLNGQSSSGVANAIQSNRSRGCSVISGHIDARVRGVLETGGLGCAQLGNVNRLTDLPNLGCANELGSINRTGSVAEFLAVGTVVDVDDLNVLDRTLLNLVQVGIGVDVQGVSTSAAVDAVKRAECGCTSTKNYKLRNIMLSQFSICILPSE